MTKPLGHLQLQVMEVVWRLEPTTVPQVHEILSQSRKIAYTTVLTTMRGLERRGMVRHEGQGTAKAYVYHSVVSREEYAASSVNQLVKDLFDGREEKLLCHLLGAQRIGRKELAGIRRMLAREKT